MARKGEIRTLSPWAGSRQEKVRRQQIYTHISKKQLLDIKHPLDSDKGIDNQ